MNWEMQFKNAMILFYNKIYSKNITWALTGSYRLYLSGLSVEPSDIDIISNRNGVYSIESTLLDYSKKPVSFSSNGSIMSDFGILNIDNINIELMGDVRNLIDGEWQEHLDWDRNIEMINIFDIKIPILSIKYEYFIYKKLKNIKICNLIENFFDPRSL